MTTSPIQAFIPDYLAFRGRHGYTSTRIDVLKTFDRYLTTRKTEILTAIDPVIIMGYAQGLLQTKTPKTVNAHLSTLDGFFRYLQRMDVCESNPLEDYARYRIHNFCPYVFSDSEVHRILSSLAADVSSSHYLRSFQIRLSRYCMILIMARCGLRASEVCRLRLKDVSPSEKTIFIEQTKFHKDRMIPVSSEVIREITNYLEVRRLHSHSKDSDYLFFSPHGFHHGVGSLQRHFRHKIQKLGIWRDPEIRADTAFGSPSPHSLRHAFAVRTVRRWQAMGLPINQIADTLATYMGHAEFASTQVYLKALSWGPGDLIFTSTRRG